MLRASNKQGLIDLISGELRKRGCHVINSSGDADVDITKAAVEASCYHTTTLIGEDTDLLVLLLFYAQPGSKDLYFRLDKSAATTAYHINCLMSALGDKVCSQLLFIHAFSGCVLHLKSSVLEKRQSFKRLQKEIL